MHVYSAIYQCTIMYTVQCQCTCACTVQLPVQNHCPVNTHRVHPRYIGSTVLLGGISPKWPYKLDRNVRPSVNISALSYSSLITEPTVLKLHMTILDMNPHNRSILDFLHFRHVTQRMRSKCPMSFIYFLPHFWADYLIFVMMIEAIGPHYRSLWYFPISEYVT